MRVEAKLGQCWKDMHRVTVLFLKRVEFGVRRYVWEKARVAFGKSFHHVGLRILIEEQPLRSSPSHSSSPSDSLLHPYFILCHFFEHRKLTCVCCICAHCFVFLRCSQGDRSSRTARPKSCFLISPEFSTVTHRIA